MNLKWYKIDIVCEDSYKPPFFIGSMIRGALGFALKKVVCINPTYECSGCFSANSCLFYRFYEEKNSYHSYRLSTRLGEDRLEFSIYLFEDAVSKLPYILSSIYTLLEVNGLGKDKERVKIKNIKVSNSLVYKDGKFLSLNDIKPQEFNPKDNLNDTLLLNFKTPLRIKSNNRFLRDAKEGLKLITLINSIHRRYYQIKGLEIPKLNYQIQGELKSNLKYLELYRYSNRQKSKMRLGGLMGEIDLYNLDRVSSLYLQLGEILGVGKQTVFGLGDYELKSIY